MSIHKLLLCLMIGCSLPLYTLVAAKPHKTEKHHSKKNKKKHKKKKGNKGKQKKQTKSQGKASAASSNRPHTDCYWVVPGRLLAGNYPAKGGNLKKCIDAGITFFVDLTGKGSYIEQYRKQGKAIEYRSMPIKNHYAPTMAFMKKILDTIDNALAQGHNVYVHCAAGKGRTGTVVGAYLVRHGMKGPQALAQVAKWWKEIKKRSQSPEQTVQRRFVEKYSEA